MNKWIVESPSRLLTFIKNKLKGLESTKDVRWAIEHNRCCVNEKVERFGSYSLKKGDHVSFWPEKRPTFRFEKERVLYEDNFLLAYNKPAYIDSEALAKLLSVLCVHRLDRDTTGVILFAKDFKTAQKIEELFRARKMEKIYLALVEGFLEGSGVIEKPMAPAKRREGSVLWGLSQEGVYAKTEWECVKQNKNFSLLMCKPFTGRTHQIRVHLQSIGHPVLGDFEYGSRQIKPEIFRQLLHAYQLNFLHPETHENLAIQAEYPSDFSSFLEKNLS